ncbi:HesA/MoeB/ThiF family protein [Humisphaera borealis]|uniref:HesA/MoeB/ThiF family protein n=1 Tax=Humisphaera borealis TaxID=2807512 RepID=A0A7M2WWH1_9BACT|nr:HesA/MoeB/ThiF family protein [Humisphaera borealis]QOV89739.1 HesA/MoeB/ThiF family protein [Humisphaera borealis]
MKPPTEEPPLTDEERAIYAWQMRIPGLGEPGQQKLKGASVLISRCGGLGGAVAYELAAAGVGRLVIAHAGNVKPSDLNRQLLMTHDQIGRSRIESIDRRLRELNPRLEIVPVAENVSSANADRLVAQADIVVDAAPLFEERFALNDAAVRQHKPMVECAVYEMDVHVTTILPGRTPCLRCIVPEMPVDWKRQFPILGAVSGVAGCIGAVEVVKLLTGIGKPLAGVRLVMNLDTMQVRQLKLMRDPGCPACGSPAS